MGGEFLAGIIFSAVVGYIAYRVYKEKRGRKSGGVKSKLPADRQK